MKHFFMNINPAKDDFVFKTESFVFTLKKSLKILKKNSYNKACGEKIKKIFFNLGNTGGFFVFSDGN